MFNPESPYDHANHGNQVPLITPLEHRCNSPYAGISNANTTITETVQKVARRLEEQGKPVEPSDDFPIEEEA